MSFTLPYAIKRTLQFDPQSKVLMVANGYNISVVMRTIYGEQFLLGVVAPKDLKKWFRGRVDIMISKFPPFEKERNTHLVTESFNLKSFYSTYSLLLTIQESVHHSLALTVATSLRVLIEKGFANDHEMTDIWRDALCAMALSRED